MHRCTVVNGRNILYEMFSIFFRETIKHQLQKQKTLHHHNKNNPSSFPFSLPSLLQYHPPLQFHRSTEATSQTLSDYPPLHLSASVTSADLQIPSADHRSSPQTLHPPTLHPPTLHPPTLHPPDSPPPRSVSADPSADHPYLSWRCSRGALSRILWGVPEAKDRHYTPTSPLLSSAVSQITEATPRLSHTLHLSASVCLSASVTSADLQFHRSTDLQICRSADHRSNP
jgi:hypothetical protein